MAMTYACGKTTVDVQKVVDVVRSAGAAIMQVYTEDAKVCTMLLYQHVLVYEVCMLSS